MDIRKTLKVFVLFLDGIIGIIVILLVMVPLWLTNIITSWVIKMLCNAQTKKILNGDYPQSKVDRTYRWHQRVRWVRRQLAKAYFYGIEHLKPLEEREKYNDED